jgi:transcriptional regulator with XRE-family HTH domain
MRLRSPEALTLARQQAQVTQRGLAEIVGISNGTVGDLENGRRTTVSTTIATAVAAALNCAETRLFVPDANRMYPGHPDEFWRARKSTGLFQTQVAAAAGCSVDTIKRLENGQVSWVAPATATAVAHALAASVERLFPSTVSSLSDQHGLRGEQPGRVA